MGVIYTLHVYRFSVASTRVFLVGIRSRRRASRTLSIGTVVLGAILMLFREVVAYVHEDDIPKPIALLYCGDLASKRLGRIGIEGFGRKAQDAMYSGDRTAWYWTPSSCFSAQKTSLCP